jgi:diguanylate cyclase (GGDEF)-like protein
MYPRPEPADYIVEGEGALGVDLMLRIDLNVFSVFFAFVLALSSRSRNERPFLDYRLFMAMLCGAIFELTTDTLMWLADPATGAGGRALLLGLSVLYYAAHPFVPMFYAAYAMHQVAGEARGLRSKLPILAIPAAASAILSLSSPFTGWYFYLDAAGVYRHGPLFQVFAAASYVYLAFSFAFVAARRKAVDDRTLAGLLIFPLLPAVAGLLQMRYYGLVLIWPSIVLSLLVIYVNIQQRKLSSDYLTGAFNRRRLDEYLEARVREFREAAAGKDRGAATRFAGFLADVDDFKAINDRFGHAAGDEALVETVRLIRASLRAEDFLARYAGDEFVVILPLSSEEELAQVVERVRSRFAGFSPAGARYRLGLSLGSASFDPEIDENADRYIERLDALMYREKDAKKARKGKK